MKKIKKQTKRPIIDINKLERKLPSKKRRSHHVAIKIKDVDKNFRVGRGVVHALRGVNLNLYAGEFVIVYGPSGCGKSTFLHTVLGLEPPSRGEVYLRGSNIYSMSSDERTNFRREKIGMVFQQSNWIKSLNVLENVAYPLWLSGYAYESALERARKFLEDVQMVEYADQKSTELSGGQQQRVALARALSTDPWIIMADEPTGNLDSQSSEDIIGLLARLNREKRRMVMMVTHEMSFLDIATRRIGMKDGEIIYDEND